MNEPLWLERDSILEIHRQALAAGGMDGLRDNCLLESAINRAQNVWAYEGASLFELAASYAEGIARNHAFIDGNKRTAFATAATFLKLNGYDLKPSGHYADLVVQLAEGKISREAFAADLEANSVPAKSRPAADTEISRAFDRVTDASPWPSAAKAAPAAPSGKSLPGMTTGTSG